MENSKKKTISEKLEGVQYLKQPDLQSNALLFKRSDNNPELPENFKVGKAVGGGDCFFDSVAQGLRQLKPEIVFTVKSLREICKKFAESQLEDDYSWLKEALKGENQQINEYITRIEFTAGDVEQKPEPNALGMVSPIWGRSDIEGRIICKLYGVQLHILEKHIVEEREVWLDQLISSETSKSINNINYNEQNTVHIINTGNAHFNPIINHKNLQASVEQSSTQRKRTKTDSEEDRMEDTSSKKLKTSSQAVEIVGLDQAKKVLDDEEIEITSVAGNMSVQAMARLQNKPTYQKWEQKGFDINNYQGIEEYSPSKADDIPTTSIEEKQQSATKSNKPLQDHIPDKRKEFLLSVFKSAEINGIKHFNTYHRKINRIGRYKLTITLLGTALELDAKEVISCIHKLAKNKGELEKVLNSTSHTLELQNGKILHYTPIGWAIQGGNVSQISTILELARARGLNKLACNSLFIAIKLCNIVAVSYIIKNFVVPNIIDENTNTPLHMAAVCGNTRIVEVLIENDAYVNAGNGIGNVPLHVATENNNVEIVDALLNRGANVNVENYHGYTPLHVAVAKNNIVLIDALLNRGADINVEDYHGYTPLYIAVAKNNVEIVDALLNRGADINVKDYHGYTPLHIAVAKNNVEIVDALLNRGADTNIRNDKWYTPLHIAVAKNNVEIVDALLNRGADINVKNNHGYTPLQLSILKGYKGILSCLLERIKPDINERLEIGSNCDMTLLLFAAQNGHKGVVELLIEEGADTDVSFCSEVTFLEYCVSERVEMVETLIALETRLDYFENREELYNLIQSRLSHDLEQQMLEYRSRCIDELERMKEKKINKSCTLYDILKSKEANKLTSYVRDRNMRGKLKKAKSEFPIFAERIESQYQKGKERLDLLEQGSSNLHKVFPPKAFLYNILNNVLTSKESNKLASSLREKDMESKLEEAKSEFPILAYLIESKNKSVIEILDLLEQVSGNLPVLVPEEVSLQVFELLDNVDIKRFNEAVNGIEKWIGTSFSMHRGKQSSECFSASNIKEPNTEVREVNIESKNKTVIGERT